MQWLHEISAFLRDTLATRRKLSAAYRDSWLHREDCDQQLTEIQWPHVEN